MVQRLQLNVRRVLNKKNEPSEDPPKAKYDDEELEVIANKLLLVFNTLTEDIREL